VTLYTLLLPVDFSTRSASVAAHARALAHRRQVRIVVLHVIRPLESLAEGVDVPAQAVMRWYEERRPAVEAALGEFVSIYLPGFDVRQAMAQGDPAVEILKAANEVNASLILMGTHGYGPFRQFLLGSVTAKVLHDSRIPVLTGVHIGIPDKETEELRRILVAIDVDDRALQLLKAGASLAREFGADLHVVHVTPEGSAGMARYFDAAWTAEAARSLQQDVESLVQAAEVSGTIHLVSGGIASSIREVASRIDASLVIIGRRHEDDFAGRLRAHGYAIVRESPCPVLSL
jgi:nucleotide-binding universal stress UspA family protein